MKNKHVEKRQTCPVCGESVIDLAHLSGGRPRTYCGSECRRIAERQRRQAAARRRYADYLASLSPAMQRLHRQAELATQRLIDSLPPASALEQTMKGMAEEEDR